MPYFDDPAFQDKLVRHITADRLFLGKTARLLTSDDLKPGRDGAGWAKWVVASLGLDYWTRYRQPIGTLLSSEIKDYCRKNRVGKNQVEQLVDYLAKLQEVTLEAGRSLEDKVIQYKKEKKKAEAIEQMIDLHGAGQLTDDTMVSLCRAALDVLLEKNYDSRDIFDAGELEKRIARRLNRTTDPPLLFIDPLDRRVRLIERGQIGLWVAPYKRGKSTALIHTAIALAMQANRVIFINAEDPMNVVEDRFDAAITNLPYASLTDYPDVVRERFQRVRRMLRGRIKVVDGRGGRCTLNWIEGIIQDYREQGFIPDALIIDYDKKIVPPLKMTAGMPNYMQFDAIYLRLEKISVNYQLYTWTAVQTQRGTENLHIISGDRVSEDITRLQKAGVALSIGRPSEDMPPDWVYLWVAAHKTDRRDFGVHIAQRLTSGMFYDRERTMRYLANQRRRRVQTDETSGGTA